jgi:hypothetical protein
MRALSVMLSVILVCAPLASPLGAQLVARWESDGCSDARVAATVGRCGLLMSGDELLRGIPSTVVVIEEPFSPIRLSRYVRGDSARAYALRYERQSRTAGVLRFIGGGLVLGESIATLSGRAPVQRADGRTNRTNATVMLSGMAVIVASVPLRWLARENGVRAVDAHNRLLIRE